MPAPLRTVDPVDLLRGTPLTRVNTYDDASVVDRMKRMFREEWDKPFWEDLRQHVATDIGYYTGSGQWDAAVRAEMAKANKPALTLNHIKPTCNVIFGLERMNRFDPKASPEGREDEDVAAVFTRLLKRTHQDTNAEFVLSAGFQEMVIGGAVAYELPIDYSEDPFNGKIRLKTVRVPDELMWATPSYEYDLSDTRAMWRWKWVDVDDLVALYPNKRAEIVDALAAVISLDPRDASQNKAMVRQGDPSDQYSADTGIRPQDDREFWFKEQENRVRVLESYYPVYYPVWLLAMGKGKRVIQSTSEPKMKKILADLVTMRMKANPDGDPTDGLQLIQRNVRVIEMAVILPATDTLLERGTPFEKDMHSYPYVPGFADVVRDEIQGVVRSLRDPQDEINSRRSQVAWLVKATGDGWFAEENTLVDAQKFQEESRDPKGVYFVKRGTQNFPARIPPPAVSTELFRIIVMAVNEIREISGVNAAMRGEQEGDPSGVAMARAMQQGQVVTMPIFDNFKLTKRLIYQKMARRIQEVYTDERVIRLYNEDTGEDEFVTINQQPPEEPADVPAGLKPGVVAKVLNDITALKYDVQLVEVPASPTQRAANLANLLELLQKVPGVTPQFIEEIVESMDGISQKTRRRVKKWVAETIDAPPAKEPPKISVSVRGELTPQQAADIADGALDGQVGGGKDVAAEMGAANGNAQNPSGQLPTGGANLQNRPDLPPRA